MAPNKEANISELLRKVVNDPNAASELLAVAADYLKARESMPDALADYLADAFRQAARTKQPKNGKRVEDERINQLAHGLYMKRSPEGGAPRKEIQKTKDVVVAVALTMGLTKTLIPKDVKPLLQAIGNNGEKKAQLLYDSRRASLSEGEVIAEFEKEFGLTESTAYNRFKEIKAELETASKQMDEIKKTNGLKSFVRSRKV